MAVDPVDPDDINLTFVPRFRDRVATVPVADEAVVYEEDTGTLHKLNPIAASVCALFDGNTSLEAVIQELVDAFGADPEVVTNDVLAMARDLAQKGLLVIGASSRGTDA